MVIETADCLVDTIRELGLLDPVQMDVLGNDLAGRYDTPRDLGRHLIKSEWLTAFQINQILQGRGEKLRLGPYALLERIGSGGMGEVFKARHRKLQRIAAVKVISRQRLDNPMVLRRFLREAEAAARLSHPHIVAVHDAGEQDEVYYLAMEYIDGIDLAHLLHQMGPLPVTLACDFLRQAALGLQHAHEQDFVHRDIKPQNLLAAPRGGLGESRLGRPVPFERMVGATVKVLDLGLVQRETDRVADTELALTQKGLVIGTMDYLAPEQARNSHRVDRRADLYSLGCTLYHLLAGRPPFPGGMPLDKLLRHQTETPDALRVFREDVPGELQVLVTRLLAKRPDERPASAAEVALALVPFCATGSLTVKRTQKEPRRAKPYHPSAPTRAVEIGPHSTEDKTDSSTLESPPLIRRRSSRPARTRRWRWWLGGAIGAALILALLVSASGPKRKNSSRTPTEIKKASDKPAG